MNNKESMYKTFIATYKNAFGLLMTKEVFAKTIKQAISRFEKSNPYASLHEMKVGV